MVMIIEWLCNIFIYEQIAGQTKLFYFGMATGQGEENFEFRFVKLHFKRDLVLYSARVEGLGKSMKFFFL